MKEPAWSIKKSSGPQRLPQVVPLFADIVTSPFPLPVISMMSIMNAPESLAALRYVALLVACERYAESLDVKISNDHAQKVGEGTDVKNALMKKETHEERNFAKDSEHERSINPI